MPILFILLIIIPVIEIYFFILIGGMIGVWPTISLIILTAILGAFFIKREGLHILTTMRDELAASKIPMQKIIEGVCVLLAGALLLTPGFMTDAIGFLLIIRPTRRLIGEEIITWIIGKIGFSFLSGGFTNHRNGSYDTATTKKYGEAKHTDEAVTTVEYEEVIDIKKHDK
jgi:UPF0716 protein FxsA